LTANIRTEIAVAEAEAKAQALEIVGKASAIAEEVSIKKFEEMVTGI